MPHTASASNSIITVYFCVSIFQLISSLPTYPPREHNLTYTYLYLFYSRCFHKPKQHVPIPFQISYIFDGLSIIQPTDCVFLCKYLSTYFFLTHIPTHKCKLNLYLPLPILFQMLFVKKYIFSLPFHPKIPGCDSWGP